MFNRVSPFKHAHVVATYLGRYPSLIMEYNSLLPFQATFRLTPHFPTSGIISLVYNEKDNYFATFGLLDRSRKDCIHPTESDDKIIECIRMALLDSQYESSLIYLEGGDVFRALEVMLEVRTFTFVLESYRSLTSSR